MVQRQLELAGLTGQLGDAQEQRSLLAGVGQRQRVGGVGHRGRQIAVADGVGGGGQAPARGEQAVAQGAVVARHRGGGDRVAREQAIVEGQRGAAVVLEARRRGQLAAEQVSGTGRRRRRR